MQQQQIVMRQADEALQDSRRRFIEQTAQLHGYNEVYRMGTHAVEVHASESARMAEQLNGTQTTALRAKQQYVLLARDREFSAFRMRIALFTGMVAGAMLMLAGGAAAGLLPWWLTVGGAGGALVFYIAVVSVYVSRNASRAPSDWDRHMWAPPPT